MLFLDGIYIDSTHGSRVRFRWVKAPTSEDLRQLTPVWGVCIFFTLYQRYHLCINCGEFFIHPEHGIVHIPKPMKILNSLAVVQIALVLLLFTKLGSFEDRMDLLTNSVGQVQGNAQEAAPSSQNRPLTGPSGLDGHEVRRIVREELLAARSNDSPAQNSDTVPTDLVFDEAEMQYQRDLVTQELDFLKQQDEVTTIELDRLMVDIAQLAPENRTELLRMLNRAMNRGEIKGSL